MGAFPAGGILLLGLVLAFAGCQRKEVAEAEPGESAEAVSAGGFVLGDLVEPFTPPPLEELEAEVKWIEQPVLDAMKLLQERLAKEEPPATVEEALRLRNDSPEANAKILSALGRLPESPEEVDWNSAITRHAPSDMRSTNPLLMSSTVEFELAGLTGMWFFQFDADFNLFGAEETVVSWHSSEDRMFDKVVIRDDLIWSDGRPITAHDVVFSFKVIMSGQVPVPAQRSGTDKLKWIEAYDDQTLVYFHKEPLATNPWNLSFSTIPKHIYENSIHEDPTLQNSDYHAGIERHPVTGGPYVIDRRSVGREVALKRRESWHTIQGRQIREIPFFEEVRFRVIPESSVALLALKAGDLAEKILTPEEWRTKTTEADFYRNNTKVFGTEWVYFYFGWNNDTVFFSDPRVRRAMSYAYDHEELHKILLYGLYEPSNGIFHPTSRWAPKEPPLPYGQNQDMAEKLLEEAGWVDTDGDGVRDKVVDGRRWKFEFSILVANIPDRVAMCNLLRQNLAELGIICHVRPLEFTVYQEKTLRGHFHAFFGGWGTGTYPDTNENIWKTKAPRNFIRYSNPEVDELFDLAVRELDDEKRRELFARIHLILYEDQPYTWLYFRNSFYGFNKNLRGYNLSPRGPYNYFPGFGSIWAPQL